MYLRYVIGPNIGPDGFANVFTCLWKYIVLAIALSVYFLEYCSVWFPFHGINTFLYYHMYL